MKKIIVKQRNYHKGFKFSECISKVTIGNTCSADLAKKLDSYKELQGVKIVNNLK